MKHYVEALKAKINAGPTAPSIDTRQSRRAALWAKVMGQHSRRLIGGSDRPWRRFQARYAFRDQWGHMSRAAQGR